MKKNIFDFELAQGINSRRSVKELLYSLKLCKSILKYNQQQALEYSHEVALLEHELSTREKERPYSGLINIKGELLIIEAQRAILNRNLKDYYRL